MCRFINIPVATLAIPLLLALGIALPTTAQSPAPVPARTPTIAQPLLPVVSAPPKVVPPVIPSTTSKAQLTRRGHSVYFTSRDSLRNPYPLRRLQPRGAFVVPATPLPVDSTGNATVSCPMDGNDSLGDCGEAMVAHVSNILTFGQGKPGWTEDVFNLSALENQYENVSGGDNGLDEDEVVNQIWKVGIAGNPQAVCTDALDFDVTNVPLTQYLIDQFYTVELAWSVPNKFLNDFDTGTIWSSPGNPNPMNGHYTPLASVRSGSVSGTDITGYYELWTWGTYCYVSPAFVASVQPQAFVAFSPQQFSPTTGLDSKGRHITTQAAVWAAIGGNPIPAAVIVTFPPVPVPTPTPTPVPVPVPVPPAPTPTPVPVPTPTPVPTPPTPTPTPVPPSGTGFTGIITVTNGMITGVSIPLGAKP